MTSSANDEWNHQSLCDGINMLEAERRHLIRIYGNPSSEMVRNIEHTVQFIEYNMREMEIVGGNGD